MFVIDKEYALCPVGKPQFDMKYRVVDDDGNDVPDGEIGEFVFENPYVRGYINLPEETAKVFKGCRYFEEKYGNVEWMAYPKIDVVTCENKLGELSYRG